MNNLRSLFRLMPLPAQRALKFAWNTFNQSPLTKSGQRHRWVRNHYSAFGQAERAKLFLSIARFMHINRPIPGYYLEFGCNEANTMRMAWDTFHHLFDLTYVAFDSFQGLPDIPKIDEQAIWEKGKLAYPEKEFIDVVVGNGMPRDRLITVKGFYDHSLNAETKARLAPHKAAVIYVDCDLYSSTVPVLSWMIDFLQKGTVVVFDDWNCFHADPERGERRAWKEFTELHPELRFIDFVRTAEAQSFIFQGKQ